MNYRLVREVLRRARAQAATERDGVPRVGMTLDEAADRSGLNRATIHSIENIKREPDLKPELETIERLALVYGLTLSAVFAKLESRERGHDSGGVAKTGGVPRDRAVQAPAPVAPPDLQEELGSALVRFVHAVTRQQAPATRPARSGGRKGHRKNR